MVHHHPGHQEADPEHQAPDAYSGTQADAEPDPKADAISDADTYTYTCTCTDAYAYAYAATSAADAAFVNRWRNRRS